MTTTMEGLKERVGSDIQPVSLWRSAYNHITVPRIAHVLADMPHTFQGHHGGDDLRIRTEASTKQVALWHSGGALVLSSLLYVEATTNAIGRLDDLEAHLTLYDEDFGQHEQHQHYSLHGDRHTLGIGAVLRGIQNAAQLIERS